MDELPRKRHWYDGRFYALILDPALRSLQRAVADAIPAGSRVLDVACGTGALLRLLAPRIRYGTGIELSQKMARRASRDVYEAGCDHIHIIHGDARRLPTLLGREIAAEPSPWPFDVATCVIALHEMSPLVRRQVLQGMHRMAPTLLIADFAVPAPPFPASAIHSLAERLAGAEHYRNYRAYLTTGVVPELTALGRRCRILSSIHRGVYQVLRADGEARDCDARDIS